MPFHVYILVSGKDRSFYIGHTSDLEDRLTRHNEGRCRYTKSKIPRTLVYKEELASRSDAMLREKARKAVKNRERLAELIRSIG